MAITKSDLVDILHQSLGIFTKPQCANILESALDIIKDELVSGRDVKISGFGKWSIREKKARRGRNPQTGKNIVIKARKVVTFRHSSVLARRLNLEKG